MTELSSHSEVRSPTDLTARTPRGEWPPTILDLPLILTDRQLAHLRDVTIRTLQRERRQGRAIPFRRVGRKIFYSRDDVLAFFAAESGERTMEANARSVHLGCTMIMDPCEGFLHIREQASTAEKSGIRSGS